MMEYQSTRNPELHATAAQAVLQGLAPDGGLYTMPSLAQVKLDWQAVLQLETLSMAREILAALLIEQIDTKYMYSFRSSRVVIESEESVPWTLDGEFGGEHTHVEITNNQRAVEIRMPEEVRDTLVAEEEEGY